MSAPLVDQPTSAPTEKVVAGTVGAAASQVVVWVVESLANIDIPTPVELAAAVLFTFAAGYFKRDRDLPGRHAAQD